MVSPAGANRGGSKAVDGGRLLLITLEFSRLWRFLRSPVGDEVLSVEQEVGGSSPPDCTTR